MATQTCIQEAAFKLYYEDNQFQSDDPIGPQVDIPTGVHDIEVSWDRKASYMRAVINGKTWFFKQLQGKSQIISTDDDKGRMNLRGLARIDGDVLSLYRDPDAIPHPMVENGTQLTPTHNRLCYYREKRVWRLRNERLHWQHPDALKLVTGYVGDFNAEWPKNDKVAHLFHNGKVVIDSEGLAHLYDN